MLISIAKLFLSITEWDPKWKVLKSKSWTFIDIYYNCIIDNFQLFETITGKFYTVHAIVGQVAKKKYLPYIVCMHYCVQRADTIHAIVIRQNCFLLFTSTLRNNACKQSRVSTFAPLIVNRTHVVTCPTAVWSLPFDSFMWIT